MDHKVEEINLNNKLEELSLSLPSTISFFPENFETAGAKEEFIFTESMVDLNKVFRQSNINLEVFGGDTELYRSRKNADIYLPAVFLSLSVLAENSNLVSVYLNILSSYVYDRLKGSIGKKTAHVEFLIETTEKGKINKVSYKGEASGIKDLEKVIKALK